MRPSRKAATAISSAALRAMQARGAGGGLVGEAEAGEAVEVGRGEVELGEGGEIEGEGGACGVTGGAAGRSG